MKSKKGLSKFLIHIFTPKFLVALHFGMIASWFLNDRLTPLLFSASISEKSIPIRFGILLIYTSILSLVIYIAVNQFDKSLSKMDARLKTGKNIPKLENVFVKLKTLGQRKWLIVLLMIILSAGISLYIFGDNLNAQWWIIDDHEFMAFLGADGNLPLREIPERLMVDTEVGDIGGKSRYRPSYYFLRLVETSLWGNNPMWFYAFRLLICTIFIFVCWQISSSMIGFLGGLVFTLALMSADYWPEIFSRLGPTESYVVLGLSLFVFGFYGLIKNKPSRASALHCFLIFLGAIISIGSKENMVILAIPIMYLLGNSAAKKQLKISQVVFSLAALLFSALIVYAVLLGLSNKGGRDIYATDVSAFALSEILMNEIRTLPYSIIKYYSLFILTIAISYALIIGGLSGQVSLLKNTPGQVKQNTYHIVLKCLIYIGCVYLLFLSQRVFYAQGWPTGLRYDFPGKLGEMFTLIILINTILEIFSILKTEKFTTLLFKCGYCCLFFITMVQNKYFAYSREYARDNVARTTHFSQYIQRIKRETSPHPDYPIIFQTYAELDFEPIFSTRYFLLANDMPNKVSIQMVDYSSQSFEENTLGRSLASKLEQTSQNGGWVYFSPLLDTSELNGKCYSVGFSGESNPDCISLGRIW
jgi:hypothetical protein